MNISDVLEVLKALASALADLASVGRFLFDLWQENKQRNG